MAGIAGGEDTDAIDFESQVRPILVEHCADCHGPDDQQSSLRLDAHHAALRGGDGGPVIVPGDSSGSELIRRITAEDDDQRMPPGESLEAADIELLSRWIDAGAPWPLSRYDRDAAVDHRLQHWSFQPLRCVDPPAVAPLTLRGGHGMFSVDNPLDRFVAAGLVGQGLSPSPQADRPTLIRRLSLSLLGIPPTPEQIDAFVADPAPDAWPRLVEQMLASPHYGERWAQHWLDVIRYADTHGFEVNTPRENAWPYRDYVIAALNDDLPYDIFIRQQLAGDLLGADEATGFLVASAVLLPGQIGKDEPSKRLARQDALDEIIVGTTGALLGLTVGCARCHDHKFDPITAEDYYRLQAFFAGVHYGDRPIRDKAYRRRREEADSLAARIADLEARLQTLQPPAYPGQTLLVDEQDERLVTVLAEPNGSGENPPGEQPGFRDDPGSDQRIGNISDGRYTWWDNHPGKDVLAYRPGVQGTFDLWLSWGVHGSGVHTRDARYVLDIDGDPLTRDDQTELAQVDQYYPAGVSSGTTDKQPLWSGLWHAGTIRLRPESAILVRGGQTGTGITADVIVLQQADRPDSDHDTGDGSSPLVDFVLGPAAGVERMPRLRQPVDPAENVEPFAPVKARFVRFTTLATIDDNRHQPCLDELEVWSVDDGSQPPRNVALASEGTVATSSGNIADSGIHQLKHINDDRYGNSYSWISNERGGGWVQLELAAEQMIDRVVWGRDRLGKYRDRLPVRYTIATSLDGQHWHPVATSDDRLPLGSADDPVQVLLRHTASADGRQGDDAAPEPAKLVQQLDRLRQRKQRLEQPRMVYGGKFSEPGETFLLRRGDPEQPLRPVQPAVPAMFTAVAESGSEAPQTVTSTARASVASRDSTIDWSGSLDEDQRRRVMLADWIAAADNPLTARVMVNRIWQYHFGRGLVDTPSDFGLSGSLPSHPELLDWLAAELIRSGWSVKHIHRLILNSSTWRQSHTIDAAAAAIDRDNRWLWRFRSRRLQAEAIRDSMLVASGELNRSMGGPGFNFFRSRGGLSGFPPVEQFTGKELRRMIYAHKVRMEAVPVFGALDCPDAGQPMPVRGDSTTAIQSLNLFNSPFVIDRAAHLAERVASEAGPETPRQIEHAFRLALGRRPTPRERQACVDVAAEHGLATVCRVLLNSNEFLYLP